MTYIIVAAVAAIIAVLLTILILSPKLKRIKYDNDKIEQENLDLRENNNHLLQERDQILKEIDAIERERANIQQDITHLIKEQDIHKDNLITLKAQAQQSADIFYEQAMKIAEQRFDADLALEERAFGDAQGKAQDEYLQILEDCVNNFQAQIEERQAKMLELDLALAELKAKFDAAVEQAKREIELKEKQDFYRIIIPEDEKSEIEALKSIENQIKNKRSLQMFIWTNYYSKAVNELANRVLGPKEVVGIYKITNIETGQMYIGQSRDVRSRWRDHTKCCLGIDCPSTNKFYKNAMKYGIENFTFELQEQCMDRELNDREKYWISFFQANTFGYNGTSGGS